MMIINVEENAITQEKKRQDRMTKSYEAKELKYEYSNYDGEYRFVIYTPLTKEELLDLNEKLNKIKKPSK